jgi:hypothetical protein
MWPPSLTSLKGLALLRPRNFDGRLTDGEAAVLFADDEDDTTAVLWGDALLEYWLHILGERKDPDQATRAVVHAENCSLRRKAELARLGRKPVARYGEWLGPFSEAITEKGFSKRRDYRFCPKCSPPPKAPHRYGPQRLLSPRYRNSQAGSDPG